MSNPTTVEVEAVLRLSWGCDNMYLKLFNDIQVLSIEVIQVLPKQS